MANSEAEEKLTLVLQEIRAFRHELKKEYNQQVEKLKRKEAFLNETLDDLYNIRLKVKSVAVSVDEYGNPSVKVLYEVPIQVVKFDEQGNPKYPKFLVSANKLGLLSIEDMNKIHAKVLEARFQEAKLEK